MDWRTRKIVDNLYGPGGTVLFHIVLRITDGIGRMRYLSGEACGDVVAVDL